MKYEFLEKLDPASSHGKLLAHIQPGTVVLECGCAGGYMTKYMKEKMDCSVYIVEYDQSGFDSAIRFAEDGICADLMENAWFEKFSHLRFDYILFADVLEHLRDPLSVMQKAVSLLKDSGTVLVSLPNVGHNDIVIKLLNGKWDYTSLGLLDDTHIHFWGVNNLDTFFEEAGLSITLKDCTIAPTTHTEQFAGSVVNLDEKLHATIKDRVDGEVYQFILAMQKADFVAQNGIPTINNLPQGSNSLQTQALLKQLYELKTAIQDKNRHIHNLDLIMSAKDHHVRNLEQVIDAKDRHIQNLDVILNKSASEHTEMKETCHQQHEQIKTLMLERDKLCGELSHYKTHYVSAIEQCEDLKIQLANAQGMYHAISNAAWWKITKPGRVVVNAIKRILKSNRYTYLFCKGLKSLFKEGFRVTWKKVKRKLSNAVDYTKARMPLYTPDELEAQKKVQFPRDIKFSILVPLYNTPEKFLREMIESVRGQTYSNWELCLADGSDNEHNKVGKICKQFVKSDKRVTYKKLEENKGISGNTNACIEMATGDYIALFDHDDLLHPAALFEMMKAICYQEADMIYTDENTFHDTPADAYFPHFKPDYAPDTLRSYNYICHFTAFSRKLLEKAGGGFRSEFDGSQDYDLILRLTEKAENVVHIPKILYYWRSHKNSVASDISAKPYTMVAAKRALSEHLNRIGLKGTVLDSTIPSTYRIAYEIEGEPLISILIPNKDHISDLKKCIDSICIKSTYKNWEIIVVENNSTEAETFEYYKELQNDSRVHVVTWTSEFNYSAINNFGAQYARGEYILLLNNDVEIITDDWLEQMLMFAQRSDVGAVGAMLYYPDDTVQHAGVILGIGGVAGHAHKYFQRGSYGYVSRMTIAQNYSCVTAACVLIRRSVWNEINGLDEAFKVAFNDVDLCMRIRKAGYLVVWTPYAELYHYESKSRGAEDTIEKQGRFKGEVLRFQGRWGEELVKGDPYYNPNLSLTREDFSLKE